MMYYVSGFEPYTAQDGRKGFAYYASKECANGHKPAFVVYSADLIQGIDVGDCVLPDVETSRDGKLFIKGFQKV